MSKRKTRDLLLRERRKLASLIDGFEKLESDIQFIREKRGTLRYCVDYRELRRYLDLEPKPGELGGDRQALAEEYLLALLFHRLPWPVILLPEYYQEFRENVEYLTFGKRDLDSERQLWLTSLRRRLKEEIEGEDGLMKALEKVAQEDRGITDDGIFAIRKRISDVLSNIVSGASSARKAVAFVQRFDDLYRRERIAGLKAFIPPEHKVIKAGAVYWRARAFFESRRAGKEAANERDARVLDGIYQMNRSLRSRRELFVVISSADSMRQAIDYINEVDLGGIGERLELRDLSYWSLWFSSMLRSDAQGIPSIVQVRWLQQEFLPVLRNLEKQCGRLVVALDAVNEDSQGNVLGELLRDASGVLDEMGHQLALISEPIVDGKWLLAELESMFLPISDEIEFAGPIEKLRSILERIEGPGLQDLDFIRKQLREHVALLEGILLRVESDALMSVVRRLEVWSGELGVGLIISGEEIEEAYEPLFCVLEEGGRASVGEVKAMCSRIEQQRGPSYDSMILRARCLLVEECPDDALAALASIDPVNRRRPSFLFTEAICREQKGDLVTAESILRSLEKESGGGAVLLRLAAVLAKKAMSGSEDSLLLEAVETARAAYAGSVGRSLALEAEAAVLLYRLELLRSERRNDHPWLQKVRIDLAELLAKCSERAEYSEKREQLNSLIGQVDGVLVALESSGWATLN